MGVGCAASTGRSGALTMKAVIVLAGLSAGGAERVISLITAQWADMGREVVVIAFDSPTDPIYHAFDPRVRIVRLGLATTSGRLVDGLTTNARRIGRLRSILKRERPDIVISFLTKINAVTLAATAGLDIPVVVSERNNPMRQASHPLWALMLRLLYARAYKIVMQTEASIACLPRKVRAKAIVIPNPIAAAHLREQAGGDTANFVAVGRLVEQKGFDLLIEAFARIAEKLPQWRLVIWGEGDGRPALERQVETLGLQDRIALPGLSGSARGWIDDADIFVLSSRYEGFPNVLGEAMAAGIPPIAFDCPFGPAEIIVDGQDGLIVPAENVDALAGAMARLATDAALRRHLGDAARASVARFDITAVLSRWEEVLPDGPPTASYG